MSGLVSVNGKITDAASAVIPALDRGLLFGDNVFEVLVAFGSQILDTSKHLRRLRESAEQIDLTIPWSDEELVFELKTMTDELKAAKANLRLVITRGNGMGLRIPDNVTPTRIIYAFPAKIEDRDLYDKGITLKRRMSPITERGASAKTGNYLRSITALKQAEKEGFDDVLWSNSAGEITEATTANIFFIGREGDLVEIATPPPSSGILLGITRSTIAQLLNQSKIPVTERIIYADEIARFDEAFVCSTVRGLVPVRAIDQHKLQTTRPNAVFHHVERLYLSWVESKIGYRVDWNTGKKV